MKKNKIIFILLICLCSCQSNKKSGTSNKSVVDKKPNPFATIYAENFIGNSPISVFKIPSIKDSTSHYILYNKKDTLQIPIKESDILFIANKENYRDTIFVKQGDTIPISSNNNVLTIKTKPISITIKNLFNKVEKEKNNRNITDKLYQINFSAPLRLISEFEKLKPIYPIKKNINNQDLQQVTEVLLSNYTLKIKNYDTLLKTNNISISTNKLFKEISKYRLFHDLSLLNGFFKSEETKKILSSDFFINDSLIGSNYDKSILNSFINKIVLNKEREFSRSKQYTDYKKAYDDMHNYLQGNLLKHAKFLCVENMFDVGESYVSINKYFDNFKNTYNDDKLNKIIEERYLLKPTETGESTQLYLINNKNEETTLANILETNKGNVIYIDFWASWCGPCRKAMPDIEKLKKEYTNQTIKFIYLSMDRDVESWEKASRQEQIHDYEHSYVIIQSKQSKFLENLSIKEIPRYLIFDKNGILVHQDAPGPSFKKIRELLNGYLKK